MSNSNAPFGFRPVNHLNSGLAGLALRTFAAQGATAIFIGDTVQLGGSAVKVRGCDTPLPTVIAGTTGSTTVGVVVGFDVVPGSLDTPQYYSTSENVTTIARAVRVCTDPDQVYEIQAGGTTVPVVANVGLNASLSATAGNTTSGVSNMTINMTTVATTVALDCQILGFAQELDNDLDTTNGAYSRLLVKLNIHQFGNAVKGA